jgi:hypothetical protein
VRSAEDLGDKAAEVEDEEEEEEDLDLTTEELGEEGELAMMNEDSEEGEMEGDVADSFLGERSRLSLPPRRLFGNLRSAPADDDSMWLPQRRSDDGSSLSTSPNSSLEVVRA